MGESGATPLSYDPQTVAKSNVEDFAVKLRERGLRPTPQRRAVWSVFEGKQSGHLSADDVLKRARRTLPEIARGTVYNALAELVAAGLLGTIKVASTQLYDANLEPHEHFLCSICGSLYDVVPRGADRLRVDEPGFTVDRVQVLFEGTCPRCAPA
jgi:Fe2+ or Zn2+ uptake regulation protein